MKKDCFGFGEILLPKDVAVKDWAVVACDQYTSDKEYWYKLEREVKGPSTLKLIFPECFLTGNDGERIEKIIAEQRRYIRDGVFRPIDGTVMLRRKTRRGNMHHGLMCLVDLDEYSARPGDKALIRATEGLVESRIPPRLAIRKDCPIELPHAILLIDDPLRTVIEPLIGKGERLYDGELNMGGGEITGYRIGDVSGVTEALRNLEREMKERYGEKALFLVGDGNHSLAVAKACRNENEPLSKYALVEIVNIYDDGLVFLPVHRVVLTSDNGKFLEGLKAFFTDADSYTDVYIGDERITVPFPSDAVEGVRATQEYIDAYFAENGGSVDFIHGDAELKAAASRFGAVGIKQKAMDKRTFFGYVLKNGSLPKKTFSIGEADEKRYYMEARCVKSEYMEKIR